jgi:hypothetical protein
MCHRSTKGHAPGIGVKQFLPGLFICRLKSKCYEERWIGGKICGRVEKANAAGMEYPGEEDFSR